MSFLPVRRYMRPKASVAPGDVIVESMYRCLRFSGKPSMLGASPWMQGMSLARN